MTDAMNEFFRHRPDRPSHPDFWRLSQVVLGMDAMAEDSDKSLQEALAVVPLDYRSATYMALQRGGRSFGDPIAQAVGAACWLDGFIAGVRYRESLGHD